MKTKLLYKLHSGKNPKFIYYLINYLQLPILNFFYQMFLQRTLKSVEKREDKEYIKQRVNYYNKISKNFQLPLQAPELKEHKLEGQKVYFFDTYQYTRYFSQKLRWMFCPGDVNFIPEYPSITKTRPLAKHNKNGVIMKLDKVRHFIFLHDTKPFSAKKNMVIFRGKIKNKPPRQKFMSMFLHHPMFNIGDVSKNTSDPQEWQKGKTTLWEHLSYKFIMALEGNDVASNLKWIMSSNSIAVMPHPTCESWFMEGTLIPNYHYIEIKEDFSDLEDRLNYYIQHPQEAQDIINHANEYISQFKNKKRERLISLLVLDKYFKLTRQKR